MRFGSRRRQEKLYKQWAKYAGLPDEAIPQKEAPAAKPERYLNEARRPNVLRRIDVLYIVLGFSILVFCAGLVLLFIHSC